MAVAQSADAYLASLAQVIGYESCSVPFGLSPLGANYR